MTTEILAEHFRTPVWFELKNPESDLCNVLNANPLKLDPKRMRISVELLTYFTTLHCQDSGKVNTKDKAEMLYDLCQLD